MQKFKFQGSVVGSHDLLLDQNFITEGSVIGSHDLLLDQNFIVDSEVIQSLGSPSLTYAGTDPATNVHYLWWSLLG